ncbi:mannan polymerase [Lipomyces oligophaga]|uniref:mannan polymerase n=1 Tax=Lipomyces oligophaga TaxID=45792 RepID=UPI0034CE3D4C
MLRRPAARLPQWNSKEAELKDSFKPRQRRVGIRKFCVIGATTVGYLALGLVVIVGVMNVISLIQYRRQHPDIKGMYARNLSPELTNVEYYELDDTQSKINERVLICVPLRDAEEHIPLLFSHLRNLTYAHSLIDLSFLVSDSSDATMDVLLLELANIQADPDLNLRFNKADIYEKDFGQLIGQGFSDRHGFSAQASRRKMMGRARNWLLTASLQPYHAWVYWRDADVERAPTTILEDLMAHEKDVIVPNVWRPLPEWVEGDDREQPYDLNSWQESESGRDLAKSLPESAVIVEGYAEFATWRPHLAYSRDPEHGDLHDEVPLDGVGGVSLLVRAEVFRAGANFPGFSFLNHAETEGFGKMARKMGYSIVGLPNYLVWHIFEPSVDDKPPQPPKKKAIRRPVSPKKRKQQRKSAAAAAAAATGAASADSDKNSDYDEEDHEFRVPQVPTDDDLDNTPQNAPDT